VRKIEPIEIHILEESGCLIPKECLSEKNSVTIHSDHLQLCDGKSTTKGNVNKKWDEGAITKAKSNATRLAEWFIE